MHVIIVIQYCQVYIYVHKNYSYINHDQLLHCTGDKPTLKLLQALKHGEKRVKVIESVAAEWEQLAIALEFDSPVIDYLRRDFNHDAKGAVTQVLTKWLNGESDSGRPITWDTLIQCLNDAGQVGIAEDLDNLLRDELKT